MSGILFIEACETVSRFGFFWVIQSSLILAVGLLIGRLAERCGSAIQSMVYRGTLVATLLCPLVVLAMHHFDISGFSIVSRWQGFATATEGPVSEVEPSPIAPDPLPTTVREDSTAHELNRNLWQESSDASETARAVTLESTPRAATEVTPIRLTATSTLAPGRVCRVIAACAWLCISTCLLIRLADAYRRLWKTLRHATPSSPSDQELCDRVAETVGVDAPRLIRSPYFASPFLAGIRKPVIHLPGEDETEGDLREILFHELAHLKRRDCHWRMLRQLELALFFFQPFLWRLSKCLEAAAEEVCDDYAVSLGAVRETYANRLVDLAERSDFPLAAAVGMASSRSLLYRRVKRIMDSQRQLSLRASRHGLAAVLAGTLVLTAMTGFLVAPSGNAIAQPPDQAAVSTEAARENEPTRLTESKAAGADKVTGVVVGNIGPVAGAEVYWWRSRVHDIDPMQPVRAVTDSKGRFALTRTPLDPNSPAGWDFREEMIIRASGHGFDRSSPQYAANRKPSWASILTGGLTAYTIPSEGEPIKGRLVDIDGQPISGARIRIRNFTEDRGTGSNKEMTAEERTSSRQAKVGHLLNVIEHVPMRDALPSAKSDKNGLFELRGLPEHQLFQLLVERDGIQSTDLIVRNYGDEVVSVPPPRHEPNEPATKVYPAKFMAVIGPSRPIKGIVRDLETGVPIANAVVRAIEVHGERVTSSREREHFATRTDELGRYTITGMPIGEDNRLVAFTTGEVPYMPVGISVDTSVSGPSVSHDFLLGRGIWASGRVYEADSDEPFPGEVTYSWFDYRAMEELYPGTKRAYLDGRYYTNANGEFRIPVLPTAGVIGFSNGNRDHERMAPYPRGYGAHELVKYADERGGFYLTAPMSIFPGNFNRVALVDPQPGQNVVKIDMDLRRSEPIQVTVFDLDGSTFEREIEFYGGNERFGWETRSSKNLVVGDLLKNQRRKVFAFDRQRDLVGGTIVEHENEGPFEIRLAPAGTATGRLVEPDGQPITDATITIDYGAFQEDDTTGVWAAVKGKRASPTKVQTDEEGRFTITGLSPDWKYTATANHNRKSFTTQFGTVFDQLQIKAGESRDLGDVPLDSQQ